MAKSKVHSSLSHNTLQSIIHFGENLRMARKKRQLTMKQLAERVAVSYQTITRLEKGDPTVSIGIVAAVMEVFTFLDQVKALAKPELDLIGNSLIKQRLPQKIRTKQSDFDI